MVEEDRRDAGRPRHEPTAPFAQGDRSRTAGSSPTSASSTTARCRDHFAIIPTLQAPKQPVARPSRSSTTWWSSASWRSSSRPPSTW
ncbi:MAG: hypothetical protein MZW92_19875 [Comamonadaceae bacterium]|nr:hypothetical protein [Comamonadaceae bacterium]